jgi:predicted metal-dependent enzyme (double-stranded beta helix superfamily)
MNAPCPSVTCLTLDDLVARLRASVRSSERRSDKICRDAAASLAPSLQDPTWLPAALMIADPRGYRRELLHEEDDGAFSIGCFVWAPGQATPIHDHRCWGVAGVLVGALREESFVSDLRGVLEKTGPDAILRAGDIGAVEPAPGDAGGLAAPALGDIHRVGAATDGVSVSIHVYGTRFAEVCGTRYAAPVVASPPGWRYGARRMSAVAERWRPYF